jgi:hypothetical protein
MDKRLSHPTAQQPSRPDPASGGVLTAQICLRGMKAPVEGLGWTFNRPFEVGRQDSIELHLPYGQVSRLHAKIHPDKYATWLLEDQGSTNGTFLNGIRVGTLAHPLRRGDLIQFADIVLRVEAINEPGHPSALELIDQIQGDSPDAVTIRQHLLWCALCRDASPMYASDNVLLMTEKEWGKASFSSEMLATLLSDRKRRLFAVACARSVEYLLRNHRARQAIDVAEAFAEGAASEEELAAAYEVACSAVRPYGGIEVERAAAQTAAPNASVAAETVWREVVAAVGRVELRRLADCLSDIAGSPFDVIAAIDPAWRTANEGAVGRMAQVIYEERRYHALPMLADVLEEAGCNLPSLLSHCRRGGQHWRGCWALDLVLGKG